MKYRLLIVDDHEMFLQLTKNFLQDHGYSVDTAKSGTEAIQKIETLDGRYALVIMDYVMSGKDGAQTAKEILQLFPEQYIAIMSNDKSQNVVLQSWKVGAVEFMDKTLSPDETLKTIAKWCEKFRDQEEGVKVKRSSASKIIESIGLVGQSLSLAEIAHSVAQFRETNKNILLLGESGTGKEKIAAALSKKGAKFFPVNCATYNGDANLMEAELFGVEKGAYTGAIPKKGIFEEASGGTVFLDEVHTLSFRAQQKLLRALQDKKIRALGGSREVTVDFKLVVAAKPELEDMVKTGEFLKDLYYRLEVLRIVIPPLRDRKEDIAPLVQHFTKKCQEEMGKEKIFTSDAVKVLERYSWPGNVRELEHAIERMCYTTANRNITADDLEEKFKSNVRDDIRVDRTRKIIEINNHERSRVLDIIQESGSQREAARRLGMKSTTFHNYLTRLGITKTDRQRRVIK